MKIFKAVFCVCFLALALGPAFVAIFVNAFWFIVTAHELWSVTQGQAFVIWLHTIVVGWASIQTAAIIYG